MTRAASIAAAAAATLTISACGGGGTSAATGSAGGGAGTTGDAQASGGGGYGYGTSSAGGSSSGSGTRGKSRARGKPSGSGSAAAISVAQASGVGRVLVDSKGMTLYMFERDSDAMSACDVACAGVWPPLLTRSGAPRVGEGADPSKLGTTKRDDGTTQVTYAGWPLYTYAADNGPGEANGTGVDSFGAAWYPLHSNGSKATG